MTPPRSPRELLPGCFELYPPVFDDVRGRFVKPFTRSALSALGVQRELAELYYSVSRDRVIRGLHLQVAPHGHEKLVFATAGAVIDVLLDLRAESPTKGRHVMVPLSAESGNAVLIAEGVAHGFCVPSGSATLLYAVTSEYAAEADTGVRWDSAGIDWPIDRPIVSERDAALPTMKEFLALHSR